LNIHSKGKSRIRVLKWLIAIVALAFLIYEIFVKHDAVALFSEYRETIKSTYPYLLIVLLLMPLNWFIEAAKWRKLLNDGNAISWLKAYKGVLMGISVGLFTPNGVGEFAGRMWVVGKDEREKAVSSSIVGSIAQLSITITIGGAFVVFFTSQILAAEWLLTAQVLATITIGIGLMAYYKMPQIAAALLSKFKFFNRFEKFKQSIQSVSTKALTEAYGFSLIRYIVFCTQLGILIYVIGGLENQVLLIMALVPVYYYIQTLIPTIALGEIGVRGFILLILFKDLLIESDVILISFLIWVINIIIPGLIGILFLSKIKMERR
jgi:hypothetical protein